MSEPNEAAGPGSNTRQFAVRRIYIKDVSFEAPNSPQVFQEEAWTPEIDISLGNRSISLGNDLLEVVLSITVTARIGTKIAYLVEVHQAGQFYIKGFSDAELREVVGSHCPGLLFPFIREVVAGLVAKGGFPQLMLAPVNFDVLYAQHMKTLQQQQQQQKAQPSQAEH